MRGNKNKILLLLMSLILIVSTGCTNASSNKSENTNEIVLVQLLTFNDLHGQFDEITDKGGGIANLAAYLKKLQSENKNTITMSAGDQIGGSPIVTALKQDQPTLEIMKEMNVDVVTTGNHEYDEGIDELARIIYGGTHSSGLEWKGSQYLDWITANVVAKEDMKFGSKDVKKGEPILDPYVIKEFEGVKIGIIGIVTTDAAKKVSPEGIKNVEFLDEVETIDKYTKELITKGVNTIVILAHVPVKSDVETNELVNLSEGNDIYDIANKVNGNVDVIIGADNHEYANSILKRENKNDILIIEAYSKGTNVGKANLSIDKTTGDVVSLEGEIISIDPKNITPDSEVAEIVSKVRDEVKPILERKVGFSKELIAKDVEDLSGESELGRLVAEAQLWAVNQKGKNIDIALMNIGGVRANLEAGDITYEEIYTIQPFGNDLTTLILNGKQLREILESQNINDWAVALLEGKYTRPIILQIAGFNYTWHPEKVDGVWKVKVDSMNLNDVAKTKIEDNTSLNCVANIFLAQGGDGFETFKEVNYEVVMSDLDALEKYIEELSKKDSNGDGTLGLSKPNLQTNPNIINLDKNFDGSIDK